MYNREEIKLLIAEVENLFRGNFLVREMSKFLAVGGILTQSPVFPINVQGNKEQSTPTGDNKTTSKQEIFLVRGGIFFGDYSDGDCFILRYQFKTDF